MTQHSMAHKNLGLSLFKKRLNDIDAYNDLMFLFIFFFTFSPSF